MNQMRISGSYEKHRQEHEHLHSAFGTDRFGQIAENVARFFGTPRYILGQTIMVIIWIALNGAAIGFRWDPYPFILLNLAFSTQAAYAAPLILLAQTRQADRDKAHEDAAARHREELADSQSRLLEENTTLTRRVAELSSEIDDLTRSIHERVVASSG
jgi:uncharacterized membrane protein